MKEYLLGIIAAALLVSVLNMLGGGGAGQGMRRLVGGILLTLAVFRPLGQLPLELPDWKEYQTAAAAAAAEGISHAQEAKRQRISDDLAAYILTKAAALGLEPEVEVILGEDDCPARIILTAAASPVERQSLTGTVVRELGLEKEKVTWIDPYQSSG